MLDNFACLERLCIFLFLVVCVMILIYLHICWSNRCYKREIRTRMRRGVS